MSQMKEQNKTLEKKTKWNADKQSTKCKIQNTGYKDVQWTYGKSAWT